MRLLIITAFARGHGGVEVYLQHVMAELARRGIEIALLAEQAGDSRRPALELPANAPSWCAEEMGAAEALQRSREFAPELIFSHRLHDIVLERALLTLAPAVFFAHNYYGTCISGTKTHSFPHPTPCRRTFGSACLAQYFPRRCGGLNPVTMLRLYSENRERLSLLREYASVLTNSHHLCDEYRRHGVAAKAAPLFAFADDSAANLQPPSDCWHLLFAGRMEKLKGGALLLEAAELLRPQLDRDLQITFAGDGPERRDWQQRANRLPGNIRVVFSSGANGGWLSQQELALLYAQSHLLIMPSLWPEPFGLAGLEAGLRSTPTVAFPLGGIPEWLHNGENGLLAKLPATAEHLAAAIARALTPQQYSRLRSGALNVARQFSIARHCDQLEAEFTRVLASLHGELAHAGARGAV